MHTIEPLESRIAPATLLPGNRSVRYFDADGDQVTVTISKSALALSDFSFATSGTGEQLRILNLANKTAFDGANISITAVPHFDQDGAGGGDGIVNIGYINATGIDLGIVNIRGDLGAIDAGDTNMKDGGLKSLTVLSLGAEDTATGAPNLLSDIVGAVGSIRITGDLSEATIAITGGISNDAFGTLGSLYVGGSIVGGFGTNSGQVVASGSVGTAKISGDLLGADGAASGVLQASKFGTVTIGGAVSGGGGNVSGKIFAAFSITKLTVGGAVVGSTGDGSGGISAESIASLSIEGSVFGGSASDSGTIAIDQNLTKLRIGGSLNGGGGSGSGTIIVGGNLGTATIQGNVFGSDSSGGLLSNTGYVEADQITSLTIGGSVIAGSGNVLNSGAIRSFNDIGSVTVKGSLEGTAANPVLITAVGQLIAPGTTNVAIHSINVLGRVFNAKILAGYAPPAGGAFSIGEPVNGDAQILSVKVGGDWIASDLIAGIESNVDSFFGDKNDFAITGGGATNATNTFSKISSIIIGGRVVGTQANDGQRFGIGAQQIASIKIGGVTPIQVFTGKSNDTFASTRSYALGTTLGTFPSDGFDVHVYEV